MTICLCRSFLLMLFCPMGYSPSGRDCSSLGPSWAAVPARSLLQCRFSVGCIFIQGTSTCCSVGSSMGCSVVLHGLQGLPAALWCLSWAAGKFYFTMVFCTGYCGMFAPSFSADLGVYGSFSHSSVSQLCAVFFILSEICYHRGATSLADVLSYVLQWVWFRAGSVHNRGSPWFLLTKATPCHVKPVQEHLLRTLTPEKKPKSNLE